MAGVARAGKRRVSSSGVGSRGANYQTQVERRLLAAVLAHGAGQSDLAERAGLSPGMLSRFVRRERSLRLDSAGKLASVLGLTLTVAE